MIGYVGQIEKLTLENNYFRHVLYTGNNTQLVLMSLKEHEEIGMEAHEHNDQFFRIEQGSVKIIMNGEESILTEAMVAIVPSGTTHNVINLAEGETKLYTLYSPPNHPDGTIHKTKAEAQAVDKD